MIYLGVRKMSTEDHPALIDAAQELLASGGGVRKEKIMGAWEGLAVLLLPEGDVHVLPGPDEGVVEFWCAEPSEEFRG
jgi:hypothetical protein